MAVKLLCSFLMLIAIAITGVDSCQNTVRLTELTVMRNGRKVTELPMKGIKSGLSAKVSVYVARTLNQEWFSARISGKAVVTLSIFGMKLNIDVPCTLPKGCEFRQMPCNAVQEYLGLRHIGCPIRGPRLYTATVAFKKPLGDLTKHIPQKYQWAKNYIKHVQVTGRVDMWDNRGAHIGCLTESFGFTN